MLMVVLIKMPVFAEEYDCPAAPDVASALLEEAGVLPRYGKGKDGGNYVADVAKHMKPKTDFDGVEKCDSIAYECAVAAYLNDDIDGYSAGVKSQYSSIVDPDESEIEFMDNGDGTGTLTITVLSLCGNGIEGLDMEDIAIDLSLVGEIKTLQVLDSQNYWDVSLEDKNNGEYEVIFTRLGSIPYKKTWGVIVDGVEISDIDVAFTYNPVLFEAKLESVEYVGTCNKYGTDLGETLTLTFSNDVFILYDDQVQAETKLEFNDASPLGHNPNFMKWEADGNRIKITVVGTFGSPRPEVGDFANAINGIVDAIENDVIIPPGGIEVVKVGGECLIEELVVDSSVMLGADSSVLELDQKYKFVASGTWKNGNVHTWVDAEYRLPVGATEPESSVGRSLRLQVNEEYFDWSDGVFNADHTYQAYFTGKGESVNFRINEGDPIVPSWYNDNVGDLIVEIYEI